MSTAPTPGATPGPLLETPAPDGPLAFVCPYCGAERPPFIFERSGGNLPIGAITYVTAFCSVPDCRKILGVTVLRFETNDEMIDRARRAGLVL